MVRGYSLGPPVKSRRWFDKHEEGLPEVAKIGAVGLFLLGITMCWRFLSVFDMNLNSVKLMLDTLMDVTWTIQVMVFSTVLSGFMTLVGCIGYVGIANERMCTNSLYLLALFPVMFMAAALWSVSFLIEEKIGHAVREQSEEFCAFRTHVKFAVMLGCSTADVGYLDRARIQTSCQADPKCTAKVEDIQKMGGCKLLDALCHNFAYEDVGAGHCLVETDGKPVVPPMVRSAVGDPVSRVCCQRQCDKEITCAGYVHDWKAGMCKLLTSYMPAWLEQEDGGTTAEAITPEQPIVPEAPPAMPTVSHLPPPVAIGEEYVPDRRRLDESSAEEAEVLPVPVVVAPPPPPVVPPQFPVTTELPAVSPGGGVEEVDSQGTKGPFDEISRVDPMFDKAMPIWSKREKSKSVDDEEAEKKEKEARHEHRKHSPSHFVSGTHFIHCRDSHWVRPQNAVDQLWDVDGEMALIYKVVGSTGNRTGSECHRKGKQTMMERQLIGIEYWLTVSSALALLVAMVSMACTCVYQYSLVPRRERRNQSFSRTLFRMIFPCVKPKHRRYSQARSGKWTSDSDYVTQTDLSSCSDSEG